MNLMLYKAISKQYDDNEILTYVNHMIPQNVLSQFKSNNYQEGQSFKILLQWFKNDFMKWMPKELHCKICDDNRSMSVQIIEGDSTTLRKNEIHTCDKCGSKQIFPRYAKILKIAETKIGRCSEWSILFGAILNSLSIQTRLVHDYLDHCWNESLINKSWIHVDSTLDNSVSFNNPYYYEQNWGKKYEYVLAFSANGIEDVTKDYTEQWQMVQKRRGKKDKVEVFKRIYLRA